MEDRLAFLEKENAALDVPVTKCVSSKYGSGDKVSVAITQSDMTPPWL